MLATVGVGVAVIILACGTAETGDGEGLHQCTGETTQSTGSNAGVNISWGGKGLEIDHDQGEECPIDLTQLPGWPTAPKFTVSGVVRQNRCATVAGCGNPPRFGSAPEYFAIDLIAKTPGGSVLSTVTEHMAYDDTTYNKAELSLTYTAGTATMQDYIRYEFHTQPLAPWFQFMVDYSGQEMCSRRVSRETTNDEQHTAGIFAVASLTVARSSATFESCLGYTA